MSNVNATNKRQEQSVELRKQEETRESRKKTETPQAGHTDPAKEYNKDWQKFSKTEEKVEAPSVQKNEEKKRSEEQQGNTFSIAELQKEHQKKNGIPA